jgi:hypothetical protein
MAALSVSAEQQLAIRTQIPNIRRTGSLLSILALVSCYSNMYLAICPG